MIPWRSSASRPGAKGRTPSWSVPAALAWLVSAWTALAVLEPPSATTPGAFLEAGACLSSGLLVMTAVRTTDRVRRVVAIARRRQVSVGAIVSRVYLRGALDGAVAAALAVPALVAGWECGGRGNDLRAALLGAVAALLAGLAAGSLCGAIGLPAFAGGALAAAGASVVLWPNSLGWVDRGPIAFPHPEAWAPGAVLAIVAASSLGVRLAAIRATTRGAT